MYKNRPPSGVISFLGNSLGSNMATDGNITHFFIIAVLALSFRACRCHGNLSCYGSFPKCPSLVLANAVSVDLVQKVVNSSGYLGVSTNLPGLASICRLPDCISNPCVHGDCIETDSDYLCRCPSNYKGKNCDQPTGEPVMFVSDANRIFVSALPDLNFTEFMSLEIKLKNFDFDYLTQTLYWTDRNGTDIWRTDLIRKTPEAVPNVPKGPGKILVVYIPELSRMLFVAYFSPTGKIGALSLDDDRVGNYTDFALDIASCKAMVADDANNYLYWTRKNGIDRKKLDGTGETEEVYTNPAIQTFSGLTFDAEGGRILFCDGSATDRAFYQDVSTTSGEIGPVVELIPGQSGISLTFKPRDVTILNGTVYWLEVPAKIGIMTHYDNVETLSYTEYNITAFENVRRLCIVYVN